MATQRASAVVQAARWISIIGHPFAVAALLVGLAASRQRNAAEATRLVLIVAGVIILPLFVYMWRKWRSGQWSTIDASRSTERPKFYRIALLLIALLTALFLLMRESAAMLRGCIAVAVLVLLLAILNRWSKLSNHMAFAVFAAVLMSSFTPGWAVALAFFAPLLAWSRLVLERHSVGEVIGGATVGAIVAAATLVL
jgi:membrane-associated phospholipid phosphatase